MDKTALFQEKPFNRYKSSSCLNLTLLIQVPVIFLSTSPTHELAQKYNFEPFPKVVKLRTAT